MYDYEPVHAQYQLYENVVPFTPDLCELIAASGYVGGYDYVRTKPREVVEVHHTYERQHYLPPVYEPNMKLVEENNREGIKWLLALVGALAILVLVVIFL